MRVLIDTNVILDLLCEREPFVDDGLNIIVGIQNGDYEGFITANIVTDLYYVLRRSLKSGGEARQATAQVLKIYKVLDTLAQDCIEALSNGMEDYEDAVMTEIAKRAEIDYIVTRNTADFVNSFIPAYHPGEFLMRFESGTLS